MRATIWSLFERLLPFCFLERNSVELYICFLGPYRLRTLLLDVSRLTSFHSVRLRVAALCFQFCFIFGLHVGKQVFVEHVGVWISHVALAWVVDGCWWLKVWILEIAGQGYGGMAQRLPRRKLGCSGVFFSFLFCGCWGLEGSRCLPNIGGILGNYSSNSVAILEGSYGVSVKARCSIELVPVGSGVFLENFYKNWFSWCAFRRAKRVSRY